MRSAISVMALMAALILGMSFSPAQAASTPSYLGQSAWTMNISNDGIDPDKVGTSVTLTGGLTKSGDNYYSFQGYISNYFSSPATPMVLSGGGAIINGKLILTLSNSAPQLADSDHDSGVMNVSLDTASNNYLNGSFSELHFTCLNNAGPYEQGVFGGTMTRTGSAIPLSPAYNAPLSLLLQ
ncbi:MAG TPA: hypothetical protein VIN67_06265 [Desulfobaccales bacterium]